MSSCGRYLLVLAFLLVEPLVNGDVASSTPISTIPLAATQETTGTPFTTPPTTESTTPKPFTSTLPNRAVRLVLNGVIEIQKSEN
uniref:Secreted protein n=1 Tax=Bursaphelenchus xylophilus TaxID=6326 RepID=A0A1I7SH72_BURXY